MAKGSTPVGTTEDCEEGARTTRTRRYGKGYLHRRVYWGVPKGPGTQGLPWCEEREESESPPTSR